MKGNIKMVWTDGMVTTLRRMAEMGKPNKEIAAKLGLPVEKIYAKRSQLGITIDKVAAERLNPNELSLKRAVVSKLQSLLQLIDPAVERLNLDDAGRTVTVRFINGHTRLINVECDSPKVIILDVVNRYE